MEFSYTENRQMVVLCLSICHAGSKPLEIGNVVVCRHLTDTKGNV